MSKVMINFSDDGGRTWSAEEWYDIETNGNGEQRVVLERQGASYGRIYRHRHSEDASFTIIEGNADISLGT